MANLTVSANIDTFMGSADNAAARSNLSAAQSGANTDIASVALTTGTISTAPGAATDIANKSYVDLVASGSSYSAVFNGSSSLRQATSFGLSVGDFTVETFVNRLGDASVAHILCDQPNGLVLYSNGATVVFGQVSGSNLASGTLAVDSNWHHVAVVRESGTLSLYVDGTRVTTTSDATNLSTSGTAEIGALFNQTGYFTGQLADVRISNIARYSGATLTVPTGIFVNDGNTLFLYLQGSTVDAGLTVNGSITFTDGPFGKVASFSGGTTGLTPSTAATGTVTLGGTLAIANGGTGQTSASAALAALGGIVTANVQTFTSSGTWTKPAGAKSVQVTVIGAGNGGASGRRGASGTANYGGGGGTGGGYSSRTLDVALLGATESVTIAAGANGGAARTADNSDGANGAVAGITSFGTYVFSGAGTFAAGGSTASGGGGSTTAQKAMMNGGNGGASSVSATAGGGNVSFAASGGGGAGGGISTAPAAFNGGTGGSAHGSNSSAAAAIGGVVGGAINGANGTSAPSNWPLSGFGAGGGASSITGVGGTGGTGGTYGGGGGGGGASLNGFNSGAGGPGGQGLVVVTTYF